MNLSALRFWVSLKSFTSTSGQRAASPVIEHLKASLIITGIPFIMTFNNLVLDSSAIEPAVNVSMSLDDIGKNICECGKSNPVVSPLSSILAKWLFNIVGLSDVINFSSPVAFNNNHRKIFANVYIDDHNAGGLKFERAFKTQGHNK